GGGIAVSPENPSALAKAIMELYEDPERAKTLGERGRQHAIANYSFEQALDAYESLLSHMALKSSVQEIALATGSGNE
ncbi:MAG: glycosyltransferase WbuB, partial [Cyanobacteria bacterium P01_D01_bin.44]